MRCERFAPPQILSGSPRPRSTASGGGRQTGRRYRLRSQRRSDSPWTLTHAVGTHNSGAEAGPSKGSRPSTTRSRQFPQSSWNEGSSAGHWEGVGDSSQNGHAGASCTATMGLLQQSCPGSSRLAHPNQAHMHRCRLAAPGKTRSGAKSIRIRARRGVTPPLSPIRLRTSSEPEFPRVPGATGSRMGERSSPIQPRSVQTCPWG